MWSLSLLALLSLGITVSSSSLANLTSLLSKNASIVHSTSGAPRWSEFAAPSPGTVVNVATENDVLVTVRDPTPVVNSMLY